MAEPDSGEVICTSLEGQGEPHGINRRVFVASVAGVCAAQASLAVARGDTRRLAWVISNANYSDVPPLRNPHHDGRLIAQVLRQQLSFDNVVERRDLGRSALFDVVSEIGRLGRGADVVFVYYSGHGMRGPGGNYLIPVDARIQQEDHIRRDGLAVSDIVQALQSSRARVALLVLDACRDNPFAGRTRSMTRGLERMGLAGGNLLVHYATEDGQVALDGDGPNSPYALALARYLPQTDRTVLLQFDAVRRRTYAATGQRQRPMREGDLEADVFLLGAPLAASVAGIAAPPAPVSAPAPAPLPPVKPMAANQAQSEAGRAMLKLGRVVVVGGGFGGATAARYLKMWASNVEVTLVERHANFISCPISNLVIGGFRQMADITLGYDRLKAMGVRLVQGDVVEINPDAKKVRLAGGAELPYDRLIVAPGIEFMTEGIDGLAVALSSGRVTHAWKAGPQTLSLRRQLEAMPDGGVYALTVPKAPYRCPPAPYERACMVAAYLKSHKPRSKVLVLDANPEIQSKKSLFERAFATHYRETVEYRANQALRAVDRLTARLDSEDVRADVLNVIPPQRAADLAARAGLVNINSRWISVNWQTMESTAVPGVHVLGDATFSAPAMPKSGHMANQHGKLAAAAVIQLLKGEPVNSAPVLTNACYSFVTARDAIHVASIHQFDAGDRTFRAVPGAGGVSAAANQIEARYAIGWAQNTWDDMLGPWALRASR